MAEYHWTWEYTVRQPLVRQLALWTAMRIRQGKNLGGDDYRREEFLAYRNGESDGE